MKSVQGAIMNRRLSDQSRSEARLLGVAFLLQFATSLASGVLLQPALIVAGDVSATLRTVAGAPGLMTLAVLVDLLTALGVVFLGACLFRLLERHNRTIALVAFGIYLIEAGLLAASRLEAVRLLELATAYADGAGPEAITVQAGAALRSMDVVGSGLHVIAFGVGAILFYGLLVVSRAVPRWLSLWGLITVVPVLVLTLTGLFGIDLPFAVAVPYVPFELVAGVWFLARGGDSGASVALATS